MTKPVTRRTLLRGMMGGMAFSVGIPLLDCFLNTNGTALASGAPLPVRFGTWFWGLGVTPARFYPTKVGQDYEIMPETSSMAAVKDKLSIFSGFNVRLDGRPQFPHLSGGSTIRAGIAPDKPISIMGPSFDNVVADAIGTSTRFRSLDVTAMKNSLNNLVGRGPGNMSPLESNPQELYMRLFGPEFRDPNSTTFKVDPAVIMRKSTLSAVSDQRQSLEKRVGAADRARLDEYFTSLRQVENQLTLQMQPPPPMEECKIPTDKPAVPEQTANIDVVRQTHEVMAHLLAMALMCDQTRVFNLMLTGGASSLIRLGSSISHHQLTHEEMVDPKLGYQPQATKFVEDVMATWATFLTIMDGAREGDGTLLDHMLVVAHSDTCFAKFHTVENLPMMIAGRAGGRVKSGYHIAGNGDSVSRVVLTAMQGVGLPIDRWGKMSSETNRPITELLV